MKKIITTFLLAVSTTSSFLLAQVENRLEATNQVTGGRLQVVGSKTIELPLVDLSFQIDQGGKTTTNYELPTTNCDNSAGSLNCHLMMDPAELKNIEEGIEDLKGSLGSSAKTSVSFKIPTNTTSAAHSSVVNSPSSATMSLKNGEATSAIPIATAVEFIPVNNLPIDEPSNYFKISEEKVAKEEDVYRTKVARITTKIEEAKQASKEKYGGENAVLWDRIASKLEQSRESWDKTHKLIIQGKIEMSILWEKEAEASEVSAEEMIQAVQAHVLGNKEAAEKLTKKAWNVFFLSDASTWSLKSEEALEKANQVQGQHKDFWRSLSEQYKIAADYERKASEAHNLGKMSECVSWSWAGRSAHSSADYQAKVAEVQEAGNTQLAIGYREAAETSQRATDYLKQSALASASGKKIEGNSWGWVGRSLLSKANYQAKASEAQDAGKTALAAGYQEAIVTSQRASDQYKQSALASASGKESEGNSWGFEGKSLQAKADYQVKAIEAQEAGNTQLAVGYREAAETSQKAADQYQQSAQTIAVGKDTEGICWQWEGASLLSKANYQAKASEAQDAGKTALAAGYREAAVTSQRAADQRKLAAQTKATGKESESIIWANGGTSLQSKADYQAKASEAEDAEKTALAAGYREAAVTSQKAVDQYQQSASASASGKESESNSWGFEGQSLLSKANYQAKASEAEDAKKTALAAGYREAAVASQKASDQYKQSAQKIAGGQENEGISWQWEGASLQSKANYQAKASEAEDAEKTALTAGCREVAVTSQRAADQWKQSAQALAAGKVSEGNNWQWESMSLQKKANYQAKAIEAQEAGKIQLAAGYREAAETSQKAADQYKQSAQTYTEGKEIESNSWGWVGRSLLSKAAYQAKESEAEDVGKIELAAGYREAAVVSQKAADQWKESALAKATGHESEYTRLWQAGQVEQAEADAIAQKAEEKHFSNH